MSNRFKDLFDRFRQERKSVPTLEDTKFKLVLSSGYFDSEWYSKQAEDGLFEPEAALRHYFEIGWKNGLNPGPKFSTTGYLAANPEVEKAKINPLAHFVLIGKLQGRGPGLESDGTGSESVVSLIGPEFDSTFYLKQYPDIARSGFTPLSHFANIGWKQERNPNPNFSTKFYLQRNSDVSRAGINPFYHYVAAGRREGRIPNSIIEADENQVVIRRIVGPEFDAQFYFQQNPNLRDIGIDPLTHYIEVGWRSGCNPNSDFSVTLYLEKYSDVRAAGVDPFFHFVSEGRREGRNLNPVPRETSSDNPEQRAVIETEFDSEFYLTRYIDVKEAGIDPIEHYTNVGWKELRDPSPHFSTKYYLESNPDIADSGINPFFHFLLTGRGEGRKPVHPGGWKVRALEKLVPPHKQKLLDAQSNSAAYDALTEGEIGFDSVTASYGERWILSVSHDNFLTSVGGIQHCIKLEQQAANRKSWRYINVHPLVSSRYLASDEGWPRQGVGVVLDGSPLGSCTMERLTEWIEALHENGATVDFVVHSPLGHSVDALIALHTASVPNRSLFWLHDYFSVCPNYTLLRNDVSYCEAPPLTSVGCSVCLFGDERPVHLQRMRKLFEFCQFEVVSPSNVALDIWRSAGSLPHSKETVHEHCVIEWSQQASRGDRSRVQKIAFVGHPADHKGWNTFVRLVQEFMGDERYEFHHFGSSKVLSRGCVFTEVSVIRDGPLAMQQALANQRIDAAIVWSIWPETFSFVAHEVLASGAAIITNSNSGNIANLAARLKGNLVCASDNELMEMFRDERVIDFLNTRSSLGVQCGSQRFGAMSVDLLSSSQG